MRVPTGLLTLLTLGSLLFFPWRVAGILALLIAPWEPLLPLAVGIFFDVFGVPGATFPLFFLYGLVLTVFAFFVRERLRTSIIR